MDQVSNSRKQRGKGSGVKGKLVMMSFYTSRSSAAANHHRLGKPPPTTTTTGGRPGGGVELFFLKPDQVSPQPPKHMSVSLEDNNSRGYAVDYGDESVDIKAATYISTVRERIRLQVQANNSSSSS